MLTPVFESITMDDLFRWGPTIGFPAIGVWLFWKTRRHNNDLPLNAANEALHINAAQQPLLPPLPIGSLRFDKGIMEVRRKISTNDISAQMYFDIQNDSDSLIEFRAALSGNVNGATSPRGTITFNGYMHSKNNTKIIYATIFDIIANTQNDAKTPLLVGVLHYQINYKRLNVDKFDRVTSKTVTYTCWRPFIGEPSATEYRIVLTFADEIEK